MFHQYEYRTYGVEIAEEALAKTQQFCREQEMSLNIFRGDKRNILFDILRKTKLLMDKAHGGGRLKQAYIEYIARKR